MTFIPSPHKKDVNKIFFVLMARTESERVPNKMLRPFNNEDGCLFEIAVKKFKMAKIIPYFRVSVRDKRLIKIAKKYDIPVWKRSEASTQEPSTPKQVCDWWINASQNGFTHFIYMNPCSAIVSVKTIDRFVDRFLKSENDAMFSMIERKMLIFAERKGLFGKKLVRLNRFLGKKKYLPTLESKLAEKYFEPASVLYGGKIENIPKGNYLGSFTKIGSPEFFLMDGIEGWDIDENWQFEIAQELYKKRKDNIYR